MPPTAKLRDLNKQIITVVVNGARTIPPNLLSRGSNIISKSLNNFTQHANYRAITRQLNERFYFGVENENETTFREIYE